MNRHSQHGSALLIVLGFLSFMVVSAVAFAVWMRTERLPSSALRRTIANRYLVKAALAQAMSRVDDAIRSHPFPGAWNTNDQASVYRDMKNCAYDWWESRVFMPPDPEGIGTTAGDPNSRFAPYTKTVSVLNFEALGYLPPPLVNDVRLLARSSWAAQWDYFNFDAGRYAFCAVNVSDYLDINKLAADAPRTSYPAKQAESANEKPPPSRFSLSYLFRDDDNAFSSPNSEAMKEFDRRVHTNRGDGEGWKDAQLVSIMDYNLSAGDVNKGNFYSPFGEMVIDNGGKPINNKLTFYRSATSRDADDIKGARRQPFVTTSWFPSNELVKCGTSFNTPLDISQTPPFPQNVLQDPVADLDSVLLDANVGMSKVFWDAMVKDRHVFCGLDRFSLFDYLDENDVPLSLAMPCVERVPMITALAPVASSSVKVEFSSAQPTEEQIDETHKKKIYNTNIKMELGGMGLRTVVVYPFREGDEPKTFTTEAFARLVFVGEKDAPAEPPVSLRSNGFAKNCRPTNRDNWAEDDKSKPFTLEAGAEPNCLFVTLPSGSADTWSTDNGLEDEQRRPWREKLLEFKDPGNLEATIFRKIEYYEIEKNAQGEVVGEKRDPAKPDDYYEVVLRPFDMNGELISTDEIPAGEMKTEDFVSLKQKNYQIRPYLVTWARIKQEYDNKKTVDMVPASYEDDKTYNDIDNTEFGQNGPDMITYALGMDVPKGNSGCDSMPIMRFPCAQGMTFTFDDVAQATSPQGGDKWFVKSCYAVDPRYNWAPENWWFDETDNNPTGLKWGEAVFGKPFNNLENRRKDQDCILNKLVAYEFGSGYDRGDRADDLFLFVSNLGYLQSVGELAFLPHLSGMSENRDPNSVLGDPKEHSQGGNDPRGTLYNGKMRLRADFDTPTSSDKTMPCALAAWKSYQNYRTNPKEYTFEFGANLYRRGLVNGSQGFYVNPYTPSEEVLLAALASSPLNYWVAGKNYDWKNKRLEKKKLAFSDYNGLLFGNNSFPALSGLDLNKIVRFLHRRFEDLASMIEIPDNMGAVELYVYQKVWEDMFDALDWSGRCNLTVQDVYENLMEYYRLEESNVRNYSEMYTRDNGNGYSDLNHFARGGGKRGFVMNIRLNMGKAIHKEDLPDGGGYKTMADPLRGQHLGRDDTFCYKELSDVDRMFLHSYWRDCFAVRQQLFLIFVRAESTALGGAGEGTPAQQGGRAVALVWRDPLPTFEEKNPSDLLPSFASDVDERDGQNSYSEDRRPHRMRVLFYRQFD